MHALPCRARSARCLAFILNAATDALRVRTLPPKLVHFQELLQHFFVRLYLLQYLVRVLRVARINRRQEWTARGQNVAVREEGLSWRKEGTHARHVEVIAALLLRSASTREWNLLRHELRKRRKHALLRQHCGRSKT